jgi:aminoglycoside phosphotransferase (APT) family kinase protein
MDREEPFDLDALGEWLRPRLGVDAATVRVHGRPSGGFSAETILIDADLESDGATRTARFVIRMETPEPAVYPPQADLDMPEIEIQQRVMTALGTRTDTPVADIIGYQPDDSVLGTPFFVMRHVEGVVPIETPPYTTEGFFLDAAPADRSRLVSSGLAALAHLHAIDVDGLGLDWLAPEGITAGSLHLMDLWRRFGKTELRGRMHPHLDEAWAWLVANLPEDSGIGLCWGDARPGNIIWQDFEPACITDFEAACIGPPEFDLAWWLMFDRTMHEVVGVARPDGDPDRDTQRRLYFEHAGRAPLDTMAHEIFAAARYAVIVVRVMNRLDQRGLLPADSTVWLENPASACLRMLLDERR